MVRCDAAGALGNLEDPRAVEPLIAALNDNEGTVRYEAAAALGKIKDPRAVEPLIAALKKEEQYVLGGLASALGEIGDPRAVEPLLPLLARWEPCVSGPAKEALGKLGAPAAAPLLLAIHRGSSSVRNEKVLQGGSPDPYGCADGPWRDRGPAGRKTVDRGDGRPRCARPQGRSAGAWGGPRRRRRRDVDRSHEGRRRGSPRGSGQGPRPGGDPRAVGPLLAALADGGGYVRASAAAALRRDQGRAGGRTVAGGPQRRRIGRAFCRGQRASRVEAPTGHAGGAQRVARRGRQLGGSRQAWPARRRAADRGPQAW